MPVCKSGIDQKNKKQSGKFKVSLSAPSYKGKPTLRNRLTARAAVIFHNFMPLRILHKVMPPG
jgi:hypothetical protein